MRFLYGQNGLVGFIIDGITYTYRKNLFGDIIGIFSGNTEMATYVYDAWGNCTITKNTNGLGTLNPFRYRGYYWDSNLGLYYLISRYYDPQTGRFINSDSLDYLDPQTLGGLNLYAYCGNNPVMGVDPSGHAWYDKLWDWVNTIAGFLNPFSKLTAIGSIIVAAIDGRWADVVKDWENGCFNPFNQDKDIALESNVFSFYKGESVIRHAIPDTSSWQILGTVFLNSSIINDTDGWEKLQHEWGHGVQERLLGGGYLVTIAVPSVLYCIFGSGGYYSTPWERTADFFGGVKRSDGYKKGSLGWSIAQLLLGPIVIPFYFMFGY